jgi:hypothetical protein
MTFLVAWLGCGEGPTVSGTPERVAPLCSPWSERGLPMGDGRVVHCDARRLSVEYPPGQADTLAPSWRLAVRMDGWIEDVDSSAPGLVNVRYVRQGEVVQGAAGQGAAPEPPGSRLDLSLIDTTERTLAVLTEVAP